MAGIRLARSEDVPEIARVHVASWQSAYRGMLEDELLDGLSAADREPFWKQWIEGADVRVWLLESAGRVEGFCRLCAARPLGDPPPGFAEVTHLYVAPDRTRAGHGRALLGEALRFAREGPYAGLLLWVLEENTKARRFYETMGLAPDGARHDEPGWLGPDVFEVRFGTRFGTDDRRLDESGTGVGSRGGASG